jgi:hypothetical protein
MAREKLKYTKKLQSRMSRFGPEAKPDPHGQFKRLIRLIWPLRPFCQAKCGGRSKAA